MIVLACYELLIGVILFTFAYFILNDLQIDAMPPFTVNNYPLLRGLSIALIVIGGVHLVYGIMLIWLYKCRWWRILGYVLSVFSLPIIPTGPFFAMLFLGDMNKIHKAQNPLAIEVPEYDKNEIGKEVKINAAIMAHLPSFCIISISTYLPFNRYHVSSLPNGCNYSNEMVRICIRGYFYFGSCSGNCIQILWRKELGTDHPVWVQHFQHHMCSYCASNIFLDELGCI